MKVKQEKHISSIWHTQMKWSKETKVLVGLICALGLGACAKSGGSASVSNTAMYESSDTAAAEVTEEKAEWAADNEFVSEEGHTDAEKLVYRGALTIQTKDYETSTAKIRSMIREMGGFVENEEEYLEGSYYVREEERSLHSLFLTVRIPTEKFNDFMNGSDEAGNVISRSASAENISRRYNDVSAQIEALEKQQTRLLDMMDKAQTIEEMIQVEQRLSDVQYQLNSLKTDRSSMDTDVEYSTVNLTLREVRVYTEINEGFFERLGNRFVSGFTGFFETVQRVILAIAGLVPYLLIAAVLFLVFRKKIQLPGFLKKSGKKKDPLE